MAGIFTIACIPVAPIPVGEISAVVPAVYGVAVFAQLLTAFLLWNQYRASGYPPIAVLALALCGFGASGNRVVIGLASTKERQAQDGLDLMRRGDRALYQAKSEGRN